MNELSPTSLAEVGAALAAALENAEDRERHIEAKAIVMPAQRLLTFGSSWLRYQGRHTECDYGHQGPHLHWGLIITSDRYVDYLRAQGWAGEALESLLTKMFMDYQAGWRFSLVHCSVERAPLLMRQHIAGLWPVARRYYTMAEMLGWDGGAILRAEWFEDMFEEYTKGVREQAEMVRRASHEEGGEQIFAEGEQQ